MSIIITYDGGCYGSSEYENSFQSGIWILFTQWKTQFMSASSWFFIPWITIKYILYKVKGKLTNPFAVYIIRNE